MRVTWRTHWGILVTSISGVRLAEKLNQRSGEQSGGSKYETKRREISTKAVEADARPKGAMQRQQRLRRASRACVIHAEAAGVTQKAKEVAQSLNKLT